MEYQLVVLFIVFLTLWVFLSIFRKMGEYSGDLDEVILISGKTDPALYP